MQEHFGVNRPALLIALPCGLTASGVVMWAVRAVNALAERGHATGLILHRPAPEYSMLQVKLHPRVRTFDLGDLPRLADANGDVEPFVPGYAAAVEAILGGGDGTCVLSPNLLGDCYGIAAALTQRDARVRVLGVQHSDIEYDARVLEHYEPVIARFIGVSDHVARGLADRLGGRAGDIESLPHGVPIPMAMRTGRRHAGEPLRLLYASRLDHVAKRVLVLPALSAALAARGVAHRLTIAGDGPAAEDLRRTVEDGRPGTDAITMIGPQSPAAVAELLLEHDIFLLPSRYEGLSVAMLEAMGAGCVPVVTQVASGAAQAIDDGVNGILVASDPDEPISHTGEAMTEGVERAARDLVRLGEAARQTVRARFSIERHAERLSAIVRQAAAGAARRWPRERRAAFTAAPGVAGSGTVPAEAAGRLREVLARLDGRDIAIHGAGRHTRELAPIIQSSGARVVAVADDNLELRGQVVMGVEVVAPEEVRRTTATDVVISSWMHEEAIWRRRQVYEVMGLRVHRLYRSGCATEPG